MRLSMPSTCYVISCWPLPKLNLIVSKWQILRNILDLHSYKMVLSDRLKPLDYLKRGFFSNRV